MDHSSTIDSSNDNEHAFTNVQEALTGIKLPMTASDFVELQRQRRVMKAADSITRGLASPNSRLARLANNVRFQNAALIIIATNAVWMGVDVDWNDPGSPIPILAFDIAAHFFTAVFTMELIIRIFHYMSPTLFFTDPQLKWWNLFDLVLAFMMVLETWLLPLFQASVSLRALSSLRLFRLLRITRIFRMVPELLMMLKSMAAAARSVSSTMVLSLCVMYVFSIILTQWSKGGGAERLDRTIEGIEGFNRIYFGSIFKSMLTLFATATFDDTFFVIRGTMKDNSAMGLLLIVYILIGAFMILNILIGVICEIVSSTTDEERDKMTMERIGQIFDTIDVDRSGTVSKEEYDTKALPLLSKLGIDERILVNAFGIIDVDDSGLLEKKEFVGILYKMLHPPVSQDLLLVLKKIDMMKGELDTHVKKLREKLPGIVKDKLLDLFLGGGAWQSKSTVKLRRRKGKKFRH